MAKVRNGAAYKILSSVNLLALDVHGGQPRDRNAIVPYQWAGRPNQIWVAEKLDGPGTDEVFILSSHAGRNFVIDNSERENGRILTFSKHGRENQQWIFEPVKPEAFDVYVRNVNNGNVLELTSDGRKVRVVPKNESNNLQRWILSEA